MSIVNSFNKENTSSNKLVSRRLKSLKKKNKSTKAISSRPQLETAVNSESVEVDSDEESRGDVNSEELPEEIDTDEELLEDTNSDEEILEDTNSDVEALAELDSDDEAPEEVSASTTLPTGREAITSMKRKADLVLKEKNRKRDELYKTQKRAKLELKETSRENAVPLPTDVLDKVAHAQPKPTPPKVASKRTVFPEEDEQQNDDGDSGISSGRGDSVSKITAKQVGEVRPCISDSALQFRKRYERGVAFATKRCSGLSARQVQLGKEREKFVFNTENPMKTMRYDVNIGTSRDRKYARNKPTTNKTPSIHSKN